MKGNKKEGSTIVAQGNPPRTDGPQLVEKILDQAIGFMHTQAIHVAADLGIADLLKDGPKSIDELAAMTGAHGPSLYRLLRALAGIDIFTEIDQGIFRQTPLGSTLQRDHPLSVQPLARLVGDPSWWRSWGSLSHAIMTGEPAIEHVFDRHLFDYLGQYPQTASVFNAWMTRFSQMTDPAIVSSYNFSNFKQVVDVGGGHGNLLITILQTNPALKGVLFDLPEVVSAADLSEAPIVDRCEIGGKFMIALEI